MDNLRSFLITSIAFNILALGAILLQWYAPQQPVSPGICNVSIITPPLTPEIKRIQDGIIENLPTTNYKLTTYQAENGYNKESMQTLVNQALQEGARLLIPVGRHAALAAYEATKTSKTPIVFCEVQDPVVDHLVDTPQASGNHVTGTMRTPPDYSNFIDGISILKPAPKSIVLIHTTSDAAQEKERDDFIEACKTRAVSVECVALNPSIGLTKKMHEIVEKKPHAIMVLTQGFSDAQLKEVASICEKNRILLFCNDVKYARNNAAISFGIDEHALGKTVAKLVDTIVQKRVHPSKIPLCPLDEAFKFAVNLKILKGQGVSIEPDHLFIMQYGHILT